MTTIEAYTRGSIRRLSMKDFLTYDNLEIIPGPNLNLIIGANGTGKSTIICAICLVFGGTPKILGRSAQLVDYIKHEKQVANVMAEISDPDSENDANPVIELRIRKSGGAEHFLNNKKISRLALVDFLAGYKIQVDNLCQFLAQDKVVQFATQTPQQLLENTEKVAGADDLYQTHQLLNNDVSNKRELSADLNKHVEKLRQIGNRLEQLKPEVEKARQFQERRLKLEQLQKKRHWLEYEETRSRLSVARENLEQECKKVDVKRHELDEAESRFRLIQEREDRCTRIFDQKKNNANARKKQIDGFLERMNDKKDEAYQLRSDISNAEVDYAEKVQNIERVGEIIDDLKQQLQAASRNNLQINEELKQRQQILRQFDPRLLDLEEKKQAKSYALSNANAELQAISRELTDLENKRARKIYALRQFDHDAYQAYVWYDQNRAQFNGEVFLPFLSVNVPIASNLKFLEACVPRKDWAMFIFDDFRDLQTFLAAVEKQRNLRVSTACTTKLAKSRPAILNYQLKQLGFKDYVSNYFEAPSSVRDYLIGLSKLDQIPVGGREVDENLSNMSGTIEKYCRTFLTETRKVSITVSNYSHYTSFNDNALSAANILPDSSSDLNTKELQERKEALRIVFEEAERNLRLVEAEIASVEKEKENARQKINELLQRRNQITALERQIGIKEASLTALRQKLPDLPSLKRDLSRRLNNCLMEHFNLLKTVVKESQELSASIDHQVEPASKKLVLSREKVDVGIVLRNLTSEYKEAQELLNKLKDDMIRLKQEVDRLHRTACESIGQKLSEKQPLPKSLSEMFDGLPKSLAEIDELMDDIGNRLDNMQGIDSNAVKEHQRLTNEAQREEDCITKFEDNLKSLEENTVERRDQWLTALTDLIENINANFSGFFKALNCAGEVCLDEGEDKTNYMNYGVQIKVKFRNEEPLLALTHQRQSGGERSVSTMLYLLSLQELSQMPFRCVDEINQGMDAKNERLVFDLMTKLLSGQSGHVNLSHAQYFMLSPKLLPDLSYSRKMKVIFIGKGMGSPMCSLVDLDSLLNTSWRRS